MSTPGPWFLAGYYGSCADCGDDIVPDDMIRADGEGGYLCEECGQGDEECLLCETGGIRHAHGSEIVEG